MEYTLRESAKGMVLTINGRLDTAVAADLERAVTELLSSNMHLLIVDLNHVDFISSGCLRPLLKAHKQVNREERFMEIVGARDCVRKVFLVVGLGEMLPQNHGTMRITDIFHQKTPYNEQALMNARQFLEELSESLGLKVRRIQEMVDEFFYICQNGLDARDIETRLKNLLEDLHIQEQVAESLKNRAEIIHNQIAPFVGEGSLLDVGCGDGMIADSLNDGTRDIQLIDIIDSNITTLPFRQFDGVSIPYEDKSFDYSLLITVLHQSEDPMQLLREVKRVTRKRVIVNESVYLNEVNRRFSMFFDWFYNCVLNDKQSMPFNFNTSAGWEHIFKILEFGIIESIDIGLDQVTVPEYHWLFVLDPGY